MRRRNPGRLPLLALAASLSCGKPQTLPPGGAAGAAASIPGHAGPVSLRVEWREQPDQERYREEIERLCREALLRAGYSLDQGGPEYTLRIASVTVDTPFENIGPPSPGEGRTALVKVRPVARIDAALRLPGGREVEASGIYQGLFTGREPEAYREIAFADAAQTAAARLVRLIRAQQRFVPVKPPQ